MQICLMPRKGTILLRLVQSQVYHLYTTGQFVFGMGFEPMSTGVKVLRVTPLHQPNIWCQGGIEPPYT